MNTSASRRRRAVGTGAAPEPLAYEMMEVVGHLRRSVRRLVRRDWPYRPLTDAQIELLRLVAARPGCRVQEAAQTLGLAQNTVSTLVRRLVDKGLLERRCDERDSRAAALSLSSAATRRMAEWRDRRGEVVSGALASLEAEDRKAIERALPPLRRLVASLEGD
jgi:DNA-binding MarR family transcriptional regulator